MDPDKEIEELQAASYASGDDDSHSVDDFIRELEAKEKDLHITADMSVIEIAESFEGDDLPEELRSALEQAERAAAEAPAAAVTSGGGDLRHLHEEIVGLKSTIASLEAERDEIRKFSQQRSKEIDNLKARAERERKETYQNQIGNLALLMLPALDNLHRALESAQRLDEEKSGPFKQFFEGIGLVSEQITDILNKMGIRPIRALGEPFDPYYHEAVATVETDDFEPNTVCAELLRGYIAGERVIRHAMVQVAMPSGSNGNGPTPPSQGDPDAATLSLSE